jgi:hypothetical protein
MDLLTFLISIAILGFAIQLGQTWIVFGLMAIMILSSKDIKSVFLLLLGAGVLYVVNSIGMKEYWLIAVFLLIAAGYVLGLGKEEAPADPYAGLLGGGGGGLGGLPPM